MESKGIVDIMAKQRYKAKHIQEALISNGADGEWDSIQNIYNLVKGRVRPRDPYVYIVLSSLLQVDIDLILYRYSSHKKTVNDAVNKNINDYYTNW